MIIALAALLSFNLLAKLKETSVENLPKSSEFRKLNLPEQALVLKYALAYNPESAWKYIKDSLIINGEVVGDGHGLAHLAGNALYEKKGVSGITICDNNFSFGCFHGVTEKMMLIEGLSALTKIEENCSQIFGKEKEINEASCIHGTGHGILVWEGLRLDKALKDCDVLRNANRTYCYDGIFMEYSQTAIKENLKINTPLKDCEKLDAIYHQSCGRNVISMMLRLQQVNINNISQECSDLQSSKLKEGCLSSLGFWVAQMVQGKFDEIKTKCQELATEDARISCIFNAATEVKFQRYQNWEKVSFDLCQTLKMPYGADCINRLNSI